MELPLSSERRKFRRYPADHRVSARVLSSVEIPQEVDASFHGDIRNISTGGFCVVTNRSISISSVIRCEISPRNQSVGIPTLAQVRWTRKDADAFAIGAQFLLE